MLNAALIDDEQLVLDNLHYIIKQFNIFDVVLSTTSAVEFLEKLPTLKLDVVFVDINMPIVNGLELAERITEYNPKTNIVFVTAYEQYALDAFRVKAVDYLLKPVTSSKFKRTVDRILELHGQNLSKGVGTGEGAAPEKEEGDKKGYRISAYRGDKIYLIHPSQALYMTVMQRDVMIVTDNGSYTVRESINYWEQKLKAYQYFRCHKSYLINVDKVEVVYPMFNSTYAVKLCNCGDEIPISRTYAVEFKKLLNL